MRVAMFSTKPYDRRSFEARNGAVRPRAALSSSRASTRETAALADGFPAVCLFVNDVCDAAVLEIAGQRRHPARGAALRRLQQCRPRRRGRISGIPVVRVPAYSPHAVAEFTVGLILTLNRQIHRAYNRTRENNFALDGLLGFDLVGKTVGVIGTGKIGPWSRAAMRQGFGCEVLAHDVAADPRARSHWACPTVEPGELAARSDIITLHCPLTPADPPSRQRPRHRRWPSPA